MRSRVAVLTAVLAFAVGVAAIAVLAGTSGPELPLLAYGSTGTDEAGSASSGESRSMATADMMLYPQQVEYRMPKALAKPADSAPAYRVTGAGKADAQRLAAAFGLGDPVREDEGWASSDISRHLRVDQRGSWWFGPDEGDTGVSSSAATGSVTKSVTATVSGEETAVGECAPCPPDTICTMECKPPTRPTRTPPVRPQGMPTAAEAEQVARDLWDRAGIKVGEAKVDVQDSFSQYFVSFTPLVDGHKASGLEQSVSVGPNKAVLYASGVVLNVKKLGEYPLIDIVSALDRLNDPPAYDLGGREPAPMPMPAETREGSGTAVIVDPAPPQSSDSGSATSGGGSTGSGGDPGAPPTKDDIPVPHPEPLPIPTPPQPLFEDVTAVRVALQFDGESLLPVYVFTTASGGETMPVPAVPDKFLAKRAQ